MTHHSYGAPGAHHLMFADLIKTVTHALQHPAEDLPTWTVDLTLLEALWSDPVEYHCAAMPLFAWELDETSGEVVYRLRWPAHGGEVTAEFGAEGDTFQASRLTLQGIRHKPYPPEVPPAVRCWRDQHYT